jgi:K+-transporting ATPase ATPase A chain
MSAANIPELFLFIAILAIATPIVGSYMAWLFLKTSFGRWERGIYGLMGVRFEEEMNWKEYAAALLCFNALGLAVLFAIQLLQSRLPLNPNGAGEISWHSAFNTAVSFVTNTNWQGYAGETTMSYLTQAAGLTVQNFLSAATGIAVAIALSRGVARREETSLGNFWVDLTRTTLYLLLPLSLLFAILLVGQGIVQSISSNLSATTLEGETQVIPLGPVASQVAIKMLGTNGGGFFNANAAHPFENPTALSNFLQMLAIFLIPASLVNCYGRIVKSKKHAWIIWGVMLFLFLVMLATSLYSENLANPVLGASASMEGKETRFGVFESVLFSVVTTAASCGAVNAMHASLSPLSGGIAMLGMMLGEVVFGGVGAGLYGMMLFILLTIFMAGLMVGRTPEYLGKKIEQREITMVILAVLAPSACILLGTALAVVLPAGLSSMGNSGPHGFSEALYAFTSAAANNGSAFAGLNANTPFYNIALGLAMLVGRFGVILPILAVAGSLARKKIAPPSPGTFRVDTPLFGILLVGVILIVGGLTFFPALALGPIAEHFLLQAGRAF